MRIDLKKDRPALYQPSSREFVEVVVPPMTYLTVDGHGDPNTAPAYTSALEALYTGAYAIRFALRRRTGDEVVVGPLEGLWSSPDPDAFARRDKTAWDWTMLIPLPDVITQADVHDGLTAAAAKKPDVAVGDVQVLTLDEGGCLQILHVGGYDAEGPTLARLHREVMPARGLTWNGRHHEVYLSDPRRTAPERLRTILRQPVKAG